jgi:hypothetical protein
MKVTLEGIKAKIKGETYLVLPDGKSTLCILDLENGYTIKGLSACVDAAEFDLNLGRKYAFEDAIRQIWPLEGYLLAEKIHLDKCDGIALQSISHPVAKKATRRKQIRLNALQVEAVKSLGKRKVVRK